MCHITLVILQLLFLILDAIIKEEFGNVCEMLAESFIGMGRSAHDKFCINFINVIRKFLENLENFDVMFKSVNKIRKHRRYKFKRQLKNRGFGKRLMTFDHELQYYLYCQDPVMVIKAQVSCTLVDIITRRDCSSDIHTHLMNDYIRKFVCLAVEHAARSDIDDTILWKTIAQGRVKSANRVSIDILGKVSFVLRS